MAQFVWFLNRTSITLFHAWVTQTISHGIELNHVPNGSFVTWSLRIQNVCNNEYKLKYKIVNCEKDINNHYIKN